MLSPWIRRALIAGGFGIGESSSSILDVAAVASRGEDVPELHYSRQDLESNVQVEKRKSGQSSRIADNSEPVIERATPFFHVDLVAAVRAAETGLRAEEDFDRDSDDVEVLKSV